jgi:hypothetical protein
LHFVKNIFDKTKKAWFPRFS